MVCLTVIDLTERKQAEQALEEAQRQLEQKVKERTYDLEKSNVELQQYAYIASHDLQEPLRMVTNYLSLLEKRYKDRLDPTAEEYIRHAVDGGERMRKLIDDLLTYSRVESKEKKFAPVDMNAVVSKDITMLTPSIEAINAEIVVKTLPVIFADESQMEQAIQNLLGNAIKFHGPDRPWIQVSATKGIEEWIFSIKDNGIGLNMKYSEKIFQMFQCLHSRSEYPGTGMGLAIVKKIVVRHGGRIWIESEEGKGSTFFFTIPIVTLSLEK